MANTGFKGVDIKQTGNQLVFRASLKDSAGAKVTSGTTTLQLAELQSDGTLKSYDFNDNTFKTTALTTGTLALSHRQMNNNTVNTGLWSAALSTLTGFTKGALYFAQITNSGATPTDQEREFQYGSAEGDLVVTDNGTGVGEMNVDLKMANGTAVTLDANNVLNVSAKYWAGGLIPAPTTTGVPNVNVKSINDVSTSPVTTIKAVQGLTTADTIATYTGNTPQTGDSYAIVNSATFGNAKLVRSTTPANTLDVSATGEAGVDWANIGSPTTTVALSGTTVGVVTTLTNLPSIPANWLTSAGIAASALNGKGDWLLSSNYTAPPSAATIGGAVWDVTLSSHLTSGTTGNALNAAGSAGDPWSTALPGAYGSGTAGNILGNNLNATITSRMATYTQPTGFLAATFPSGTIANTTNITAGTITTVTTAVNLTANNDKSGYTLSSAGVQAIWDSLTSALTTAGSIGKRIIDNLTGDIYARLGAPAGASTAADIAAIKTDSAAIKLKTDNLPASPAAVGSAMTLTAAYDAAKTAATQSSVDTIGTNVSSVLARIGAFTGTGVNTILGFFKALLRSDASNPSDVGGTFDAATDSTQAIRDRGDSAWGSSGGLDAQGVANAMKLAPSTGDPAAGSVQAELQSLSAASGSGAFTVVAHVTDGTSALQNVRVSMTLNGISYYATTNSSGNATFSLDAATYTVGLALTGYTDDAAGGTVTVTASGTLTTRTMTAVVITVPGAGQSTGVAVCTVNGTPEVGRIVTFRASGVPGSTSEGIIENGDTFTAASGTDGVLSQVFAAGFFYEYRDRNGNWKQFKAGADGTAFNLPSNIGRA